MAGTQGGGWSDAGAWMGTPGVSGRASPSPGASGQASPMRQREDAHTGLNPPAKEPPPPPPMVEETVGHQPSLSNAQLTDAVMTFKKKRVQDTAWFTEVYGAVCRHADQIDQI